jgi:hypothetical protein
MFTWSFWQNSFITKCFYNDTQASDLRKGRCPVHSLGLFPLSRAHTWHGGSNDLKCDTFTCKMYATHELNITFGCSYSWVSVSKCSLKIGNCTVHLFLSVCIWSRSVACIFLANFVGTHSVVAGFAEMQLPLLSKWFVSGEVFELPSGNNFQLLFFWRNSATWVRATSFSRFLDHTQWHTA